MVADKLASHGVQGFYSKTWEARPPLWLLSFLGRDNHHFLCFVRFGINKRVLKF